MQQTFGNTRLSLLQQTTKLGRSKGIDLLRQQCDIDDSSREAFIDAVQLGIIQLFCGINVEPTCETKQGCLLALKTVLEKLQSLGKDCSDSLKVDMRSKATSLLSDGEYFLRLAAGEFLGTLSASVEECVVTELIAVIFQGLKPLNFDESNRYDKDLSMQYSTNSVGESINNSNAAAAMWKSSKMLEAAHHLSAEEIRSLTLDWRQRTTYLKALEAIVCSLAGRFRPFITDKLLNIISDCLKHSSCNVREAAADILLALLLHTGISECKIYERVDDSLIVKLICNALSDDFSQIRMLACRAVKLFFQPASHTSVEGYLLLHDSALLAALCFNRYHVAEGLRLLSQEIWEQFSFGRGKELVEENLVFVIRYYLNQMKSVNHEIRNTGLHCINELVTKLNRNLISVHVMSLLEVVQLSLGDECWPVRESACNICSSVLTLYSYETASVRDAIFTRYCELLADEWHLVRESAALAIGDVIKQRCDIPICGEEKPFDYLLHYVSERLDYCLLCLRESTPLNNEKSSSASVGCKHSVGAAGTSTGEAVGLYGKTSNIDRGECLDLLDGCICLLSALASLPVQVPLIPNNSSTLSHSMPSTIIESTTPVTAASDASTSEALHSEQSTSCESMLILEYDPANIVKGQVEPMTEQLVLCKSMPTIEFRPSDGTSSASTLSGESVSSESIISQSVASATSHSSPEKVLSSGNLLPSRSTASRNLPQNVECVIVMLPKLVDISTCSTQHYRNLVLHIICLRLPLLFTNIGKLATKRYIDLFYDSIFEAAGSDNVQTSSIGKQCIAHVSGMMGHSIFRARIESYNSTYVKYLPKIGAL